MHIAVTPDEAYIPHCAAMLHSLIAHHPGVPLDIHLLTGPVKPYWSDLGRYLDGLGSRLHIHVVSESVWTQLPETGFPRNAWLKIFLPDLLEASRVLYLDCDLIVRQNLSAIYAMDMRGRWVAAVQELIWKGSLRRLHAHVAGLGLVRPEDYFNVGVLLLDLERMRQEQCSMRMLSYAADPATPKRLPEQEAFNAAALRFLRERGERIKRVDAAVERALESMPRLEREGEGEEGESESRSTPTSFSAPEAAEASSSSPLLRTSTSPSPSPSVSLEACASVDDWHARGWAALGEAAAQGGSASGGGEPAT